MRISYIKTIQFSQFSMFNSIETVINMTSSIHVSSHVVTSIASITNVDIDNRTSTWTVAQTKAKLGQ